MAVYGTLVCGPLLAVWYRTLHTFGEVFRVSYSPLIADVATAETARGRFLAQVADPHLTAHYNSARHARTHHM